MIHITGRVRGVGTDIVALQRIAEVCERHPRFPLRILTEAEYAYCQQGKKSFLQHLAGRFAAKEAIIKALGHKVPWRDMEILNLPSGQPYVNLTGQAAERAQGGRVHVSIAHEPTFAIAIAIWEAE
ncbi:MAG: holo-ACP synthase [Armatimonadota bacterium]|nr:holo-ACP synthase [Armatimonadota bacterium]MDW8103916.1 holo-ACP synthase [Armatimonadota bacterium]MDW8289655.1 holo-ACP synthase [Armatimonadota bacterium]